MAIGDKTIEKIDTKLQSDLKEELKQQGHYLTGALEDSLASSKIDSGNKKILEVTANDYINPVNDGVAPERIPYDSSQTTGAKTSKYIEGLKNYAKLRFGISDEREALGAAFAIAKKHEKEGMPTKGSFAFSSNGQRTQSINRTLEQNERDLDTEIESGISEELDELLGFSSDVQII